MTAFLLQYGSTLLCGVAVAGALTAIVTKLIRDKRKGRGGCGCHCAGCPGAVYCQNTGRNTKTTQNDTMFLQK